MYIFVVGFVGKDPRVGKFGTQLDVHGISKHRKRLTDDELRKAAMRALERRGDDGLTDFFESMAWGRVAERVAFMSFLTKGLDNNSKSDVTARVDFSPLTWLANRSIGKTDTESVAYDPETTIDQDVMPTEDALDVESRPIEDDHGITRANDAENSDPHAPC